MTNVGGAAKTHQSVTTEATSQEILTNTETIIAAVGGGGGQSHLDLFTGDIFYVDAAMADDTGNGETPETAKKTMLAGIALMAAGDRLKVKAGTYDENGMALTLAGQQLICEAGAIFVNTTPATVFTISGLACVIDGAHFVQAGAVGLAITGIGAIITNTIAVNCTTGFDIDEHSTQMFDCTSAGHTVTAFDVGERNTKLTRCFAAGSGGATRGFYVSAAAVTRSLLDQCHSVGNATAGFEIVAVANQNSLVYCSSGGGDGRRVDAGVNNVFAAFSPNEHAIQFGGSVWYVDGTNGADTNDGLTPTTARATIGSAIGSMAAGDAVSIRTGTYDEDGLDLSLPGLEMWGEIGANVINTVGAECLTVSGNYCRVRQMSFHQAGVIGIVVTGYECELDDVRVEDATVGYDIDGAETTVCTCTSLEHTTTGFDISTGANILRKCTAINGGATRGFYLSHADADNNLLDDCSSIGNGTAGYEAIPTATENTFKDCSSGGGDGRWVGIVGNVWSNFTYDDKVYKTTTFTGASATHNIFQLTGGVRLKNLYGDVTTVLPSPGARTAYIELFSAGGAEDLTDSPGPDIQSLVVGALLVRNADSTNDIDVGDPNGTPVVVENTSWQDPATAVDVVEDNGAATYVRLVLSNTLASGAIHWQAEWEPLTDDGFLEAV